MQIDSLNYRVRCLVPPYVDSILRHAAVLALEHVDLVRTWVMTAGTAVWLTLDILVIWFITSDCRTHGCFLTTACWVLLQFKTQFCMQHISCIRVRVCVCLFIVNL